MRSVYLLYLALLILSTTTPAFAAPSVERSPTAARSYTCTYRAPSGLSVFATLSGPETTPQTCRVFGKSWGKRWYGYVPGPVGCVFKDNTRAALLKIRGRDARLTCSVLEPRLTLWTRIR